MSMLLRLSLLLLFVAPTGLAAAPTSPTARSPAPTPVLSQRAPDDAPVFFGLRFPDVIAGFPRGRVADYETDDPGLGYGVKYSARGWAIDVYIYDAGLKGIPDSLADDTVVRHFLQVRADVFAREDLADTKVDEKATFRILGGRKVRFTCSAYLIVGKGASIDSFLCLTTWNGKFVKYRLSTLHARNSVTTARRFVGGWIPVLWPVRRAPAQPAAPPPPPETRRAMMESAP